MSQYVIIMISAAISAGRGCDVKCKHSIILNHAVLAIAPPGVGHSIFDYREDFNFIHRYLALCWRLQNGTSATQDKYLYLNGQHSR